MATAQLIPPITFGTIKGTAEYLTDNTSLLVSYLSFRNHLTNTYIHKNITYIDKVIDSRSIDLQEKYDESLKETNYSPTLIQELKFKNILNEISQRVLYHVNDFEIDLSGDEDLLLIKQNNTGNHYIIVAKDGRTYYGFVGKSPGESSTIRDKGNIKVIIDTFLLK